MRRSSSFIRCCLAFASGALGAAPATRAAPLRTRSDDRLPALAEPTRPQLLVASISIAIAVLLATAVAVRLWHRVELVQWWVPFAFAGGVVAADFASGLLHWAADTWGRADLPVVGPRLLVPFRVHHLNPDDFLRRCFLDTNGDVATLTIPALAALLLLPLDSVWHHALAIGGFACCALGGMTNQIHQWAHMPAPPMLVRALQRLRVILPPAEHAAHHQGPYDAHYCITTGWCNGPLEAIRFFHRLERLITRLTGAVPRGDELVFARHHLTGIGR